jgi:hypothetical protein
MPQRNRRITITICGILTTSITAWIFGWLTAHGLQIFSLGEFRLSLLAFLPIGGIIAGISATSGYYFAGAHCHVRPRLAWCLHLLVATAILPILTYYIAYKLSGADQQTSLIEYVVDEFTNSQLEFHSIRVGEFHGHIPDGAVEIGPLGPLGLLHALIQYIGSLVGGLLIFSWWVKATDPPEPATEK